MLEPPDLAEDLIMGAVRTGYGIDARSLAFLPIGCDASAWAYRLVTADGGDYFLKVRHGAVNEAGLRVPRALHDAGVTEVLAPIPAFDGTLFVQIEDFALILYPFIDGASGTDRGLEERHWRAYGAVLRRVHDMPLPPELIRQMRRETFVPDVGGMVRRLDTLVESRSPGDESERELAVFWRERRPEIRMLLERGEALGERLRAAGLPSVLCHADIHTWNVMIDTADRFWIVDWDEAVLAPKECDLIFVIGGIVPGLVGPREERWVRAGYGEMRIDPLAFAYYRYARAISEIGAFGESVLLRPDHGAATKREAVELFKSLFDPGAIVDLAERAYTAAFDGPTA